MGSGSCTSSPAARRFLLAASLALCLTGCPRDRTLEALGHVRSGTTALETGDHDGALEHFQRAIALRDDLPAAWLGLGRVHATFAVAAARAGDLSRSNEIAVKATDAFRRAVELDADGLEGYAGLGAAYTFLGQPEKAYAVFLRMSELRRGEPQIHEALAIALVDLGRYGEAIGHFEIAIKEMPEEPALLLKLGKALVGIDRPVDALPIFLRFHELVPEDPRYLEGVGEAFLAGGAGAEALEAFRRLEDAGPGFKLDALQGQGAAHLSLGDAGAAEETFRAGLAILDRLGVSEAALHSKEVRDTVSGFHYGLARALLMAKRDSDAVASLRAAVGVNGEHIAALTLLGGLLTGLERRDEAIAVLEKLVKKAPWSEVAATLHADVLALDKRYGPAASEYERALRLSPDNSTLLNNYAWMLVTAGEKKFVNCARAIELGERAVLLSDYRSSPSLDTLAEAYHCAGRPADAIRIIEMAIHVTPEDELLFERREKYRASMEGGGR